MKRNLIAVLAGMAVVIGLAPSAWAFHEGGVAYCDGCHSMHNSSGGKAMSGGRAASLTGWNKVLVADVNGKLPYAAGYIATYGANGAASLTQFQGNNYLLQGSDNSSTCLVCHASNDAAGKNGSYHVMSYPSPAVPTERTPGGDFSWLKLTFSGTTSYGSPYTSKAERHGHNVVAADFGLFADATLTKAPGGEYAAANLSCASCHDPHSRARIVDANGTIAQSEFGKAVLPIGGSGSYGGTPVAGEEAVGVYRLLATSTYSQMSYTNPLPFNSNPPVAVAPATYNLPSKNDGTATTTNGKDASEVRVAYGAGMSEWCANCHRSIHNDNVNAANNKLIHPAGNTALLTATANNLAGDANGTTIANIYNAYKASGDLTGTSADSYTSLVPYEEGTTVIATLAGHAASDGSQMGGPKTGSENVMCLSCHRAHAGGFDSMTRWNNKSELLVIGHEWPGTDSLITEAQGANFNNGMTKAQMSAAMYDRDPTNYAFAQRSMCNKCHAKD